MIFLEGRIKEIIDRIIQERSHGNPAIAEMTKAKLILKGLNPDKFGTSSPDDPAIIEKLYNIAKQFNIYNLLDTNINIKSVYSVEISEKDAVEAIKSQLEGFCTKLVIYFAAPGYNHESLSAMMQEAFSDSLVFGCSTAGEIINGNILKNSVVAMAFNSNIICDAKIEVVENLRHNADIDAAFSSFESYFGESSYIMDTRKYVGLILIDGLCMREEKVMDLIGNRTNVIFVGGSASDDLKFSKTQVFANGRTYTDSAVLVLLKMSENAEFGIIKTQSFTMLDTVLVANKVNEETREVIEFNNKPALLAYAEAVGAASPEDAQNYFMTHPVGLCIGDNDVFIRSPQMVKGTSIRFYCNILEGMEVRLLESANIIENTKKAIENKLNELGTIDGIIDFDCVERMLELKGKDLVGQYGEIFKYIPTIGFSTFGEEYIGHLNQTSTMLIFRSKNS